MAGCQKLAQSALRGPSHQYCCISDAQLQFGVELRPRCSVPTLRGPPYALTTAWAPGGLVHTHHGAQAGQAGRPRHHAPRFAANLPRRTPKTKGGARAAQLRGQPPTRPTAGLAPRRRPPSPPTPSPFALSPPQDDALLDDIIDRLLDVRTGRPGKQVALSETEVGGAAANRPGGAPRRLLTAMPCPGCRRSASCA